MIMPVSITPVINIKNGRLRFGHGATPHRLVTSIGAVRRSSDQQASPAPITADTCMCYAVEPAATSMVQMAQTFSKSDARPTITERQDWHFETGRKIYSATISLVARIGNFRALHNAFKLAARGRL